MNWLQKFMMGRYGVDQMNIGVLIFSMVCTFTASLTRWLLLSILGTALLAYGVFRMFSRNLEKRRGENARFMEKVWWPVSRRLAGSRRQRMDKEHRYFTCPSCGAVCRVPRGKGRIVITCPRCGNEIHGKS